MNKSDIYILGVGNNTPVYIDLVEECGYNVAGLYHYEEGRTGEKVLGHTIVGSNEDLFSKESLKGLNLVVSMGNNRIRAELFRRITEKGGSVPTLIHPTAEVSRYAKLAAGVAVHAGSVIQATASVGQNSVISYNASLSHTSSVGQNSYVASGASIGAYVRIEDFVLIGQASVIISGKVEYIGEHSIVGAGSVVANKIEPNSVVKGNPAK